MNELRAAERTMERIERQLWMEVVPAFERLQRSLGPDPDACNNINRAREGVARAWAELKQMFNDIYWPDKKIPF